MISTLGWRLRQAMRSLWLPIIGFGVLGLVSTGLAALLDPVLPEGTGLRVGAEAIDQILDILATSMLTVTTFSVSIMVTAFGSAASTATPRALVLLQSDSSTRLVLSIFVGAFIYSLVGIIALNAGVYGAGGRVVLFAVTCIVLVVIVVSLMRWIGHLTVFGRLGDTLDRVEAAASEALAMRLGAPYLGGQRSDGAPPPGARPLPAGTTGHVRHVDIAGLSACAEAHDLHCHLIALPGDFVAHTQPLLQVTGMPADDALAAEIDRTLQGAFAIGPVRDFDQDPRCGIVTLTEIASRALSPAVNDPGTAIDVLGRLCGCSPPGGRPGPRRCSTRGCMSPPWPRPISCATGSARSPATGPP